MNTLYDDNFETVKKKKNRKKKRVLPQLGKKLPELCWVDIVGTSLTLLQLLLIALNFEAICFGILKAICNILTVVGILLILVGIVVIIAVSIAADSRRRRYRYERGGFF